MIYFDNAASSLIKPETVRDAVSYGIQHFGNSGRSFYEAALEAERAIYQTRVKMAQLLSLENEMFVAFTTSATDSFNLVIPGLFNSSDHIITTCLDHNSVLRPLYLLNCDMSILNCDDQGNLLYEHLPKLIKKNTKAFITSQVSNVLGNEIDMKRIKNFCQEHDLLFIVDAAQSLGARPLKARDADVICFTGHKSLFGPMGTGGIVVNREMEFNITRSGGSGYRSFEKTQSHQMPSIFEIGTMNAAAIYGLQKAIDFILQTGVKTIADHEKNLVSYAYRRMQEIPGIRLYGNPKSDTHNSILSFLIDSKSSSEISEYLWRNYQIATRSGTHCAPLLHKRFQTEEKGMCRISFSYFNKKSEIDQLLEGLETLTRTKIG